jgi:hypothetical protein
MVRPKADTTENVHLQADTTENVRLQADTTGIVPGTASGGHYARRLPPATAYRPRPTAGRFRL